MNDRNERSLTAHHEAGHAVAAVMRGGGTFTSITITPTADCAGMTRTQVMVWDAPFVVYAGPWAQARARWSEPTLDDDDADGCCFEDHVFAALMENPDDFDSYRQHLDHPILVARYDHERKMAQKHPERFDNESGSFNHIAAQEHLWTFELERVWPVIEQVAQALLNGTAVTPDQVDTLLWGADDDTDQ